MDVIIICIMIPVTTWSSDFHTRRDLPILKSHVSNAHELEEADGSNQQKSVKAKPDSMIETTANVSRKIIWGVYTTSRATVIALHWSRGLLTHSWPSRGQVCKLLEGLGPPVCHLTPPLHCH